MGVLNEKRCKIGVLNEKRCNPMLKRKDQKETMGFLKRKDQKETIGFLTPFNISNADYLLIKLI